MIRNSAALHVDCPLGMLSCAGQGLEAAADQAPARVLATEGADEGESTAAAVAAAAVEVAAGTGTGTGRGTGATTAAGTTGVKESRAESVTHATITPETTGTQVLEVAILAAMEAEVCCYFF